jgi:hypothetical protein
MEAVLAPTPENVKKVITLSAKKTHKRRKNSKFGNIHGKKFSKPRCKRPKTDQASDTPNME